MKFVGLLSGGKDSCFNLLHCVQNGHELVAAATLGPAPGKGALLPLRKSSLAHATADAPLIARALDVPLYRQVIAGTAIELGNEYGGRTRQDASHVAGDETEDLFELLSNVKAHHPNVEGVSIGAILSNYQRVRMEHVCRRLGLTPLCYLWQRDQPELLSEMIEAGMECILIKVAGIGLMTKHLGKTLAQMQPTLLKLNDQYGLHVCGEGGEYETFTLDCPLFKQRIQVQETETVIHSDSAFGTVAFLKFTSAALVDKSSTQSVNVTVPPLLDDIAQDVLDAMTEILCIVPSSSRVGEWAYVANVHAENPADSLSFDEEVRDCFAQLQEHLSRHKLGLQHVASIDILLSSMDLFPALNSIYIEHFGSSPPARACVAVDLHPPTRVSLSAVAYAKCETPQDRQALHVQGLSYWAPANIGPYSQAVTASSLLQLPFAGGQVFISGQIGLVPAALTLPAPRSLARETALSFQHVRRVLAAVAPKGLVQGAIVWLTARDQVDSVRKGWQTNLNGAESPPVIFVGAQSLPKGALVETQVMAHNGNATVVDEDGDVIERVATQVLSTAAVPFTVWKSTISDRQAFISISFSYPDLDLVVEQLTTAEGQIVQGRLFYATQIDLAVLKQIQRVCSAVSLIPVRFIVGPDGKAYDFALTVMTIVL
ncbi:adenine nucleotide alpha hydrolases-like protein [Auricularia subglabra TFB-10046 SS5]|nr:adenine nucleotide alpha hydrolases-like protein [Auricularia subglabra TFB-10046 SS5]